MKLICNYGLALLRLLLLALLTVMTVIIALPFFYLSKKARWVTYATARYWGRSALFLLNVKVHIKGQIPRSKVLLMPNHQSYLDIFLVLAYYPASIVAKKEIGQWPILKFAIDLGRIILVDRASLKGSLQTMQAINAEVKSGGSVILFPEGSTYSGPLTKGFKSGSFKIAEETQTPIIPMAIKYTDRAMAWNEESFLQNFLMKMGHWRTRVDLWFGHPIVDGDYKALELQTKVAIDQQLSSYIKP